MHSSTDSRPVAGVPQIPRVLRPPTVVALKWDSSRHLTCHRASHNRAPGPNQQKGNHR